tara:strand:- start:557 stop:820 length:264 start_codon:yes stop_codon:yes gene_type:complete
MYKYLNILLFVFVLFFVFSIYKHYSSNKNLSIKTFNRTNMDEVLKEKIEDLPILVNDTDNVIEFNDSFDQETNDDKKRSFWDLLKDK